MKKLNLVVWLGLLLLATPVRACLVMSGVGGGALFEPSPFYGDNVMPEGNHPDFNSRIPVHGRPYDFQWDTHRHGLFFGHHGDPEGYWRIAFRRFGTGDHFLERWVARGGKACGHDPDPVPLPGAALLMFSGLAVVLGHRPLRRRWHRPKN